MDDLVRFLPEGGGWSIFAVFIVLVFGAPAVFSKESVQNRFSGLHMIAAWWRRREVAAIEQEAEREKVVEVTLRGQIDSLKRMIEEEREDRKKEIEEVRSSSEARERAWRTREVVLQDQVSNQQDYIQWSAAWARRVNLWATEHGHTLPDPPWAPYHQWVPDRPRRRVVDVDSLRPREPPADSPD